MTYVGIKSIFEILPRAFPVAHGPSNQTTLLGLRAEARTHDTVTTWNLTTHTQTELSVGITQPTRGINITILNQIIFKRQVVDF